MKKLKWLVLVMCLALGLSVFVACGGDDKKGTENNTVAVTGISLPTTFTVQETEGSKLINALVQPFEADEKIVWASSDTSVVTVSTEGLAYGVAKLTYVSEGTANVTATAGGKTATCEVTAKAYVVPYYYIAGKSAGMYFDWDNYHRGVIDVKAPRLLKPVDNTDEKVFTATVDLFANDEFKICKVTESAAVDNWDNQVGGKEDALPEELQLNGEDDWTELSVQHRIGKEGNPANYKVLVEGKYEIKLDLSGETTALSFKKIGNTDPVAWSYNVYGHGKFAPATEWANSEALTATKFDKDHLTGTGTITLSVGDEFGFKTDNPSSWGGKDIMVFAEGVTGISKDGNDATCTAAGTYNITITLNEDGGFVKVEFTAFTPAE